MTRHQQRRAALRLCFLLPATPLVHSQTAPLPESPRASVPAGTASVSGTIVDRTGAAVDKATVTLVRIDGTRTRVAQDGAHGEFTFQALRAGDFELSVKATGFQTATTPIFTLAEGQSYSLPRIQLVVGLDTVVNVRSDAAEIQLKQEERQRVLGIVPNYYVVYARDPAPLSTGQKYRLAFRDTFDPIGFVGAAVGAGFEQLNNSYAGYGDDASSYGKRYAAAYGDGLTSDLLSHAVFPALFHQDPRYYYQGTGTKKSRFVHAISFSIIAHKDGGGSMPNYSYVLGDLGSGALSNLYYPHADRGAGLVFTNAGLGLLGQAAGSVMQEFVLPYLTTHSPNFGRPGKHR